MSLGVKLSEPFRLRLQGDILAVEIDAKDLEGLQKK